MKNCQHTQLDIENDYNIICKQFCVLWLITALEKSKRMNISERIYNIQNYQIFPIGLTQLRQTLVSIIIVISCMDTHMHIQNYLIIQFQTEKSEILMKHYVHFCIFLADIWYVCIKYIILTKYIKKVRKVIWKMYVGYWIPKLDLLLWKRLKWLISMPSQHTKCTHNCL